MVQNLGPGIGFLVGSWSSTFYVDFDSVSEGFFMNKKPKN